MRRTQQHDKLPQPVCFPQEQSQRQQHSDVPGIELCAADEDDDKQYPTG
jgi:hypothetical protein